MCNEVILGLGQGACCPVLETLWPTKLGMTEEGITSLQLGEAVYACVTTAVFARANPALLKARIRSTHARTQYVQPAAECVLLYA